MDDLISWYNRNKCAVFKVLIAVVLSLILIAVFAGTAATGGAGTGLAGLLVAKVGLSVALAGIAAKVLLVLVAAGVSASRIGDWIVCKLFDVPECCHEDVKFWSRYGECVEANGGNTKPTPACCEELTKMSKSLKGVSAANMDAIRKFLRDNCED